MVYEGWTIQKLIDEMAARGNRPAVIDLSDTVREACAYADLAGRAQALAGGLVAAGARPGQRAFLCGANGIDWITAYLGAMAAGLAVVPLDYLAAPPEIARTAAAVSADWAFADAGRLAGLREAAPSARCYRIGPAGDGEGRDGMADWHRLTHGADVALPALDPAAPAVLLQTSGTTGAPKLFTLSARNLAANIIPLAAAGLAGPEDRLVLPLPLYHVYPQLVGMLATFAAGATLVFPAAVTGAALRAALQGERATGVIGVPRLYEALLSGLDDAIRARGRFPRIIYRMILSVAVAARRHLALNLGRIVFGGLRRRLSPDLRLLVTGGARLDPTVAWRLAGLGFDLRSGYGLAETASTHTANLPGRSRLGTEGQPFQGGDVRIDAPDADGIGEILLRGPNVFGGYLDPAQTQAAFTPDGWFRTGDLGRLDDGFLTVTGRAKETIVLGGGKKIDPEFLERCYAASPFIAELAVLESRGRLVALVRADAAAVAAAGYVRAEGAVRAALGEAAQTLPDHERLAGFALVRTPLPRTRLGKLRRFLLGDLYRQAQAGVAAGPEKRAAMAEIDAALLRDPRAAAAWRLLQERYGQRLGGADDYLALDLGVDSLEWLNLALALETRLGVDLSTANPGNLVTVRGLLEAVGRAPKVGAMSPHAEPGARPPAADRWLRPVPGWQRWIARRVLGLNRLLIRLLFRPRVEGIGQLPPDGPFVVVCNHLSYLDAPVLAAALPPAILHRTHWGAAEDQLPAPHLLHWLWVALNVFPLEEGAPALGLACARDALDRGEVMTMFPEAWRSPDGALQPFMPGIGYLLAGRSLPVVPVRLDGTFEALPRYRRWPRLVPVRLRFGAPQSPDALAAAGSGETPEQRIADALHDAIAALGAG